MIRKVDLSMKLDTSVHSVFSLHYHLILVVKSRQPTLTDEISTYMMEMFEYIASNYKIELIKRRKK